MQLTSNRFKQTARAKLKDPKLQAALDKLQTNFVQGRAQRIAELDNFEAIRDAAANIRERALEHLDLYLTEFERKATEAGTRVHWAETTDAYAEKSRGRQAGGCRRDYDRSEAWLPCTNSPRVCHAFGGEPNTGTSNASMRASTAESPQVVASPGASSSRPRSSLRNAASR